VQDTSHRFKFDMKKDNVERYCNTTDRFPSQSRIRNLNQRQHFCIPPYKTDVSSNIFQFLYQVISNLRPYRDMKKDICLSHQIEKNCNYVRKKETITSSQ